MFSSWGKETAGAYAPEEIREKLLSLSDGEKYGEVLRAKGIVRNLSGGWIHFDYVPGEADVRDGSPAATGRLCVIGSGLKESALEELF